MFNPIITVLKHYPLRSFFTIVIMAALDVYMFRCIKKKYDKRLISGKKGIVFWVLSTYIMLLLFFTVIGRRSWDYYRYKLELGYSYREVLVTHDRALFLQIISNIAVFIPIGIMASYLSKRFKVLKGVLFSGLISFCIEIFQLVLKRGNFETDDLINNLAGAILGCLIIYVYQLAKKIKT